YSLFQRNLQCQICSGFTGKESEVTTCTGDEPVCENKITMNGVTLEFEKSCSTYRKCLAALRNNIFPCNKWTSGASCVSCCTGNLCNRNHSIEFCKENTTSTSNDTFYWPNTKIGTDVTIPCHANVATRHCSSGNVAQLEMPTNQYGTSRKCSPFTGVWQEPDMSQCYNTERITQQLKNITIVDIGKENVEQVSTILSDISKKSVYFKAEDIDLAVDIQEKMLPLISNVSAEIVLKNILLSINNMIDTPEEILVEAEQSNGTGSRMLDIIEAILEEIPLEGQQLTALYSNLGIGVIKMEKDTFNGAVYGISFGNNRTEAMITV
ncbi:uncharacterized protein LOC118761398, partial [Octopus sinensis]|uniref:Uncharacterized protein LOC118761398 n=1 Tax=Octopus sinensis TaxID=2607531 RepID=A0A7E6EJX5_9MOLL